MTVPEKKGSISRKEICAALFLASAISITSFYVGRSSGLRLSQKRLNVPGTTSVRSNSSNEELTEILRRLDALSRHDFLEVSAPQKGAMKVTSERVLLMSKKEPGKLKIVEGRVGSGKTTAIQAMLLASNKPQAILFIGAPLKNMGPYFERAAADPQQYFVPLQRKFLQE